MLKETNGSVPRDEIDSRPVGSSLSCSLIWIINMNK